MMTSECVASITGISRWFPSPLVHRTLQKPSSSVSFLTSDRTETMRSGALGFSSTRSFPSDVRRRRDNVRQFKTNRAGRLGGLFPGRLFPRGCDGCRCVSPASRLAQNTDKYDPLLSRERTMDNVMQHNVAALILGGGRGEQLYPLTKNRAEPAVTLGGVYRMVDVPISNCINSGLKQVYVLTQYNSTSLNRHIARTYNQNSGAGNNFCVEVLAAAPTPTANNWFRGTADAVRHYEWLLKDIRNRLLDHVIILSGDHLYRMDYERFLRCHLANDADVTIACTPCTREKASEYGVIKLGNRGIGDGKQIIDFAEKPTGLTLEMMRSDDHHDMEQSKPFNASMGIYIFKKEKLLELLTDTSVNDFGHEAIPLARKLSMKVFAYLFDGYWEDIGDIKSFFEANLGFNRNPPMFEFYMPGWPVYTCPHRGPPTTMLNSKISDSTISDGCHLNKCTIKNSIIGLRSYVGEESTITDAVLMGADFLESGGKREKQLNAGKVPLGIGRNCLIQNAIVDKNARIGDNCVLANLDGQMEVSMADIGVYIRQGIVVVEKGAVIPPGTKI